MKKLLVINCGSSSIKADVFALRGGEPEFVAKAFADRVGKSDATLVVKDDNTTLLSSDIAGLDMAAAISQLMSALESTGACKAAEVHAVGHRVVHGGNEYSASVVIDDAVISAIQRMSVLAPLHNPANLAGINACRALLSVPQVAVFDTAFHQTMPPVATTYAIPRELAREYGLRRYGFHGTSHEFVTRECARRMQIRYEDFNAISLHLGNGTSACAVRAGKSADTSMGFTPLEGLVMGTRSGDIDPSLPFFLQNVAKMTAADAESLLNKKSGLLGLAGASDMRELLGRAASGDAQAELAIEIFCARARKYIGAYLTWGQPHAVIFTGGIGENSPEIRMRICRGLEHLGIKLSTQENQKLASQGLISADTSLAVYAIATDEELMIAKETKKLAR